MTGTSWHEPTLTSNQTKVSLFYQIMLVVCLAEFCQGWIYGLNVPDWAIRQPLRLASWIVMPVGMALYLGGGHDLGRIARVLAPFLPLWLIGIAAGAIGFSPITSFWLSFTWMAMGISAALVSMNVPQKRIIDIVLWVFFVMMVGSIALSVTVPRYGTMLANGVPVWRGLFTNKNVLGQIAALALVIGLLMKDGDRKLVAWATSAGAAVCLIYSDSKGGLATGVSTYAILWLMPRLRARLSPAPAAIVLLFCLALMGFLAVVALPYVLELLHRDATLTGRTVIWEYYWAAIAHHPWLGMGPGAFTDQSAPTTITMRLVFMLARYGPIYTPHNAYLGVLGDTGVVGLIAFVGALIGLGLITPLLHGTGMLNLLCSAACVTVLTNGIIETGHLFRQSAAFFIILLFHAAAIEERFRAETLEGQV